MTQHANNEQVIDPPDVQALKVFISYSRADMAFADELVAGLAYDGRYDVTIDRHSILEGEDWKSRLGALIADADTIVFILSPASVKSDICAWEVEQAHQLAKRILPVLAEPVGDVAVPARLASLNYVRFDAFDDGRSRSFMGGLNALVRALNTDAAWLREHTRYLTQARSWDEAGRTPIRLLSGSDIAAAKTWAARRPKDAPQPTELHVDFFRASEDAQAAKSNAERLRLEQIEAAQQERAQALQQAEHANRLQAATSRRMLRRTAALGTVAALLVIAVVGGTSLYAINERMQDKVDQTYISLKVAGSELAYTVGHFAACSATFSEQDVKALPGNDQLATQDIKKIVNGLYDCLAVVNTILPIAEQGINDYRQKLAQVPASPWAKELVYEIGPDSVLKSPDGRIYHPGTSSFYGSVDELERAVQKKPK